MMIREQYHSDLAIPPGEYLEEVISELGMTKNELAKRMNRPPSKLSAIFSGDKAITPDTALQLEKVVGVAAHIWTGLEAEYRLVLARQKEQQELNRLREEGTLVTKFCYADLVRMGYVAKKTQPADKVLELQRFFGVTSLFNIQHLKRYQAAFRRGLHVKEKYSPEAASTWLRIGELKAQKMDCAPYQKKKLIAILPQIRSMTKKSPEEFETDLRFLLSEAGVAFVLLRHLPKTFAHGATFWLNSKKAVLILSLRGSWADIFWFSLFHEIGHILLHGSKRVFVESDEKSINQAFYEEEANRFASEYLIPKNKYRSFVETGSFSSNDIKRFAESLDIHPGIVVGRLQHDRYIKPSWHNNLRTRYKWRM
ncbi:MAG: HigA family addiction module antidote protein [Chlorobi bacterium]|nr:HigA family addiction module antidote protein [Chlorobiota bacterium]